MSSPIYSNFLFDKRLRAIERLKSRLAIEGLFKGAASEKAYPLRLVFRRVSPLESTRLPHPDKPGTLPDGVPVQMAFVASKRNFKRAVDRNFIKRRIREAYRLDKERLYLWCEKEQVFLQGMLIYTGRELPTQLQIIKAWGKILRRLDGDFFS